MHALMRDTQVPVIIALKTNEEMSPLLGGQMDASRKEMTVRNPKQLQLDPDVSINSYIGLQ